jgi:outer membrane protein OmpA-like peptidoglycan-associated protein
MMRRSLLFVLMLSVSLSGCAGSRLRSLADDTDGVIAKARENGAMRCAPVELAKAEAHNDFARQEIADGDYSRADDEAALAAANAKAAFDKSPRDKCLDAAPVLPPKEGDADGDGFKDKSDDCPRAAEDFDGYADSDGCPEPDNDSDGIDDKDDKCPMQPEDRDGFEDADGCPDPDNDKDGLVDKIDQCPMDAEDQDGFEDDDGCPDCDNDKDGVPECPEAKDKCPLEAGEPSDGCPKKYVNIVVTKDKIELKQTVFFDTRKATIKPVSFGLLDEVAQALTDHPTIKVRIEGHTDSQGQDGFNLKLSKNRAASVKAYLVKRGIDEGRMDPQGFGETVPIADNRTENGRAQNRRVEFFITAQ